MVVYLGWTVAGLLMLACGWLASAWFHQRTISMLEVRLKVLRQTAATHADQARRQIGQLQADLAGRPPAALPGAAPEPVAAAPQRPRRRAGVHHQKFARADDGFPHTALVAAEGFAPTELLN